MSSFETAHRGPLFFMHIPKTAGMGMRAHLENQYRSSDICPARQWSDVPQLSEPLAAYQLVEGHFQYNMRMALRPETKAVAILRNPLLRTVSALQHLKRDPTFHSDHAIAKHLSLPNMIRNAGLMRRQRNVQAAAFCASVPPQDVVAYLQRNSKQDPASLESQPTLGLALERAREVEFLGAVEHLWLLLAELSEVAGCHPAADLPLINNAPSQTTLAELGEEEMAILRSANEIDLLLYDRCIELIEEREFHRMMLKMVAAGIYKRMDRSFSLDLREPLPGSGWYSPEGKPGRIWRWTGPKPQFTLEIPFVGGSCFQMSMRFNTNRPLGAAGFIVRANGRPLDVSLSSGDNAYEARVRLGPDVLDTNDGCCRLVFDTGQTMNPVGSDLRLLGVAVNNVSFERLV